MAYSNLTTFAAALASHGKNFQQYLDGVPTLTLRQGAASDLNELCDSMAGYSGNTFTNLKALATLLGSSREVQNELSHTTLSMRNGARTEWTQLIAAFNAVETETGVTPGNYAATTIVIDAILAAGMPNDLGQWSDKLTTSQMANAATALTALGTAGSTAFLSSALVAYGNAVGYWRADRGIAWVGTGTSEIGTGTDDQIDTWTDLINEIEMAEYASGKAPWYTSDQGPGGTRPAIGFDSASETGLRVQSHAALATVSASGSFTLAARNRCNSVTAEQNGLICQSELDKCIYKYSTTQGIYGYSQRVAGTSGNWVSEGNAASNDVWDLVALRVAADGVGTLWKDGTKITLATDETAIGAIPDNNDWILGRGPSPSANFLTGFIFEAMIFETALTDAQMALLK